MMDKRMICDEPSPACFRGECLLCNLGRWTPLAGVEWAASLLGMQRDFIFGRVNDFPAAQTFYDYSINRAV